MCILLRLNFKISSAAGAKVNFTLVRRFAFEGFKICAALQSGEAG